MIVIPMAGLSRRFSDAGYTVPKYMLKLDGKTVFEHSVASFAGYFATEHFLFVTLNQGFRENAFIREHAAAMGIARFDVVTLSQPTRGQAETVYLGLREAAAGDVPVTIFNIDTFRPGFTYPTGFSLTAVDGYLETFIGSGKNWSNVVPVGDTDRVALTAEKQQLSQYCCTGLYYWASSRCFAELFEQYAATPTDQLQGNEYYVAPMYNALIKSGGDVRFTVVDSSEVIFCGTPDEYRALL